MKVSLLESSATLAFLKSIKVEKWFLLLTVVDVLLGAIIWTHVQDLDALRWWSEISQLISHLDEVISWLTSNPVGLKLNEPVNLALASFFRYHIYLWHTFAQFLYAPWILELVKGSLCIGFSCALAVFTDLISVFTLHIHCFDVYASSVSITKTGRELLHNVSGIARPGELMALMGASGAGKTTLLNTMLSRNLKGLDVTGRIEVNGCEIGEEITAISGYAQQEELFLGTLTVREYLSVQAKLRVRNPTKRRKRVDVVLSQLGLLKCQNTRIGVHGVKKGISGGEARRLTFACELLSNPAILFCDEPTTGLDSFMAENVVQVLSKLAKNGRTIICTIHQPASQLFLMFNKVMFLAGGRTAFVGSPPGCIEFFEQCGFPCPHNFNPADLVIHTLAVVPHEEEKCKERIKKICDTFEQGEGGKSLIDDLSSLQAGDIPDGRKRVSIPSQVAALCQRSFLDNWRNPSLAKAKIIQKSVMGLFVGLLYLQTPLSKVGISNINGALFYLVCELTYSTLFGILTFMPTDYPLLVREYHDGIYNIFSYYFARSLSYVPLFTIDGLLMMLICYWLVGFSSSIQQVLIALLTCLLIEQSSSAFGVMLSVICPSYPVAVSLAGPLLTLLSLTGGLYANVGALPSYISWVQYLSWFRYGFEALAINQWSRVNGPNSTSWTAEERDAILEGFSFHADNLLLDICVMIGYIFVFYTIGFIGLSLRVRRSR